MKTLILIAALLCAGSAFAQTSQNGTTGSQSNGGAEGQTVSNSGANSASGSSAQLVINGPLIAPSEARDLTRTITESSISGTQTVKNVPSVGGPPLVSSNDTCMGSTSGSVNVAGFGAGLGTTWTDQNCKMLKNSRELWNMGMKAAALALMCTDPMNREALELTGFKCPQSKKESQQVVQSNGERYTDPIVRARLGLPPLQ